MICQYILKLHYGKNIANIMDRVKQESTSFELLLIFRYVNCLQLYSAVFSCKRTPKKYSLSFHTKEAILEFKVRVALCRPPVVVATLEHSLEQTISKTMNIIKVPQTTECI